VTDDKGATSTDAVVVTIGQAPPPPGNVAPVADAGPDQTVTDTDGDGIASVVLDGTASFDADGAIQGYGWYEGSSQIATSLRVGVALTVGVHTITLVISDDAGATSSDTVVITVNPGAPSTPQGMLSISGPSSVSRGETVSFTLTVTNTGSDPIDDVQLTFAVSPSSRLRDISPGSAVSIGTLSPGASVSRTWAARGDKEGSATIAAEALSAGVRFAAATHALTVRK
jgi:uncharacterized repeat protein (TIGR01451 family)